MDLYCVLFFVFSSMFVPINGNCEDFIAENINCSTAACEKLTVNALYLSTLHEPRKQMMVITSDHNNYYGALISEIENITIDYTPIMHGNCESVYSFVAPKPLNSIGLVFKTLPFVEGITHWDHNESNCDSEKCKLSFSGAKKSLPRLPFTFRMAIESSPSICQVGESSSKTLNLLAKINIERMKLRLTKGFSMLIFVPPGFKFRKIPTGGEKLINFGSIEDHSSYTFVTIGIAEITDMHDKRTYAISIKASDVEEISVDPKSTNLPVACFFGGHPFGKIYEIFLQFEETSTLPEIYYAELTWSMSIGFGNRPLYRSKSTSSTILLPSKSAASTIPVLETFGLLVFALFFVFFIKKLQFEASL